MSLQRVLGVEERAELTLRGLVWSVPDREVFRLFSLRENVLNVRVPEDVT